MGDSSGAPFPSGISPPVPSRIRYSAATSVAAMMLFVVLATTWLVAAATAQVWYHSVPPGYVFPSLPPFHLWTGVGIAGVALAVGFLVHRLCRVKPRLALVVLAFCIGAAGELLVVLLVTHQAITTARYGVDSGEGTGAIVALVLAQLVLVGFLRLFVGRFARPGPERRRGWRGRVRWSGLLGIVGMIVTCGAFAAWSLYDGTTLIVSTSLIAGEPTMTNVGAWWPGLFAAMVTLTVVALACAPGIIWRTESGAEPVVPATSVGSAAFVSAERDYPQRQPWVVRFVSVHGL